MNKTVKCIIWVVVIAFLCYNSVYFKKLSEVKAADKKFDAASYAKNLYNKLPELTEKTITIDQLIEDVNADKVKAFADYGHALAIGSTRFFLINGTGTITNVSESDITVTTPGKNTVTIATEYIFGNAIRDASGQVNLNDFTNTVDLNNISAELNKIIRTKVLPPAKASLKKGDAVSFSGAVQLNQEHLDLSDPEIIPIKINLSK